MTVSDSPPDKAALRRAAKAWRRHLAPAARLHAGEAAAQQGCRFLAPFVSTHIIAAYWPLAGELDSRFLLNDLARRGARLALPVTGAAGTALNFRAWAPGDRLTEGPYQTLMPLSDAPAVTPSILVCPLLAFDREGGRLGYGGGYYDRTLTALPEARAFGLAYSAQRVDSVPTAPHDRPLEAVITDTGTLICGAQALER